MYALPIDLINYDLITKIPSKFKTLFDKALYSLKIFFGEINQADIAGRIYSKHKFMLLGFIILSTFLYILFFDWLMFFITSYQISNDLKFVAAILFITFMIKLVSSLDYYLLLAFRKYKVFFITKIIALGFYIFLLIYIIINDFNFFNFMIINCIYIFLNSLLLFFARLRFLSK